MGGPCTTASEPGIITLLMTWEKLLNLFQLGLFPPACHTGEYWAFTHDLGLSNNVLGVSEWGVATAPGHTAPPVLASRKGVDKGDGSSQLTPESSSPLPKAKKFRGFCVICLPFPQPSPPPKPQNHFGRQIWWTGQGPSYLHPWVALASFLLLVVMNHLQGRQPPHFQGHPLSSSSARHHPSSLTACPSHHSSLLCGRMISLSCSSFAGRAESWSKCPKPHLFNPSKEKTHGRPTIKRQLRLSLKELPEASPGTQPFHQLGVERAQTWGQEANISITDARKWPSAAPRPLRIVTITCF